MSKIHMRLAIARAQHTELLAANRERRRSTHRLATLLRQFTADRSYQLLGYATIGDYGRLVLDLDARQTRELLRLGRRLPDLPVLDAALAAGEIAWTKAREVSRVATAETEEAWIERAGEVTSRQLEAEVSGALRGERPPEGGPAPELEPARRRMVFEMESVDAELLQQALALYRHQAGLSPEDASNGAVLAAMARVILAQAEDSETAPSGEPYRVVLQRCPSCETTGGMESEVSDSIADEARCDAEVVDLRPGPRQGHLSRTIPPARRREVLHAWRWRCAVPDCRCRLWLDLHHLKTWAGGGGHELENLLPLCTLHHRLIHDGLLGLERQADGRLVVTRADGRRTVGPATHMGRTVDVNALTNPGFSV